MRMMKIQLFFYKLIMIQCKIQYQLIIIQMGNNDSKLTTPYIFKQFKKIDHPILGQLAQAIDTNKKIKYYIKQYNCAELDEHKQQLKKFKHRKIKNNKFVLNILYIQGQINNQFCGNSCRQYICFDYFQHDLETLYKDKIKKKIQFTEEQLFDILKNCIDALIYIQDNGLKHYHICKKSVFFISKELRILDTTIVNKTHPYFQILSKEQVSQDIFLAPELIQELKLESFDPYLSPKSDIFTLGVMILHLACLQSLASFYDYQNLSIDLESLKFKVQKIKYSNNFKELIKSMISESQQNRPGLITLKSFIESSLNKEFLAADRSHSLTMNNKNSTNRLCVRKSQPKFEKINLEATKNLEATRNEGKVNKVREQIKDESKNLSKNSSKINLRRKLSELVNTKQNIIKNSHISKNKQNYQIIISHHKNQSQISSSTKKKDIYRGQKTIQSHNESPLQNIYQNSQKKNIRTFAKLNYPNGSYFEGQVINNIPNGNGILYYSKNKICYSGSWKNNLFQGPGTLYNQNPSVLKTPYDCSNFSELNNCWIKYEGEFNQSKKSGFGTLYLCNQQRFLGKFQDDEINGFGTFYERDGKIINGEWQHNIIKKKFD